MIPQNRRQYNPQNWYWIVGGNQTQVYSSAAGDYISVSDPTYRAWISLGNVPTKIDTEANLGGVLAPFDLRPVNANILQGYLAAKASAIDRAIFQVLFNHENRIRTLAGQQQVTTQQFLTAIGSLL